MFVRNPQSLPASRRAQPEISNAMLYACPPEAELLAVGGRSLSSVADQTA